MSEENAPIFEMTLDDDELENTPETNPAAATPAGNGNGDEGLSVSEEEGNDAGDAAPVTTPATTPAATATTDEEIAAQYNTTVDTVRRAKSMGWAGKESWKGKESDFKGPEEFVRIADMSPAVMKERNDALAAELANMKKMFPAVLEMQKREIQHRNDALTQQIKDLEKQLETAKQLADAESAAALSEKLVETRIKKLMTANDEKNLESNMQIDVATNRDIEKEKAFRDAMLPRMSLAQRKSWNETVAFLDDPINMDKSTDERIQYLKETVFNIKHTAAPAVSPVARPTGFSDVTATPATKSATAGWDALSKEDKAAALELIENVSWMKNRASDPETYKRELEKFKRGFNEDR